MVPSKEMIDSAIIFLDMLTFLNSGVPNNLSNIPFGPNVLILIELLYILLLYNYIFIIKEIINLNVLNFNELLNVCAGKHVADLQLIYKVCVFLAWGHDFIKFHLVAFYWLLRLVSNSQNEEVLPLSTNLAIFWGAFLACLK